MGSTYLSFFTINQMCIWEITIYMVRSMSMVSPHTFRFFGFLEVTYYKI